LFRQGFVHIAIIVRKMMRAQTRNPDYFGFRITGLPFGNIELQIFFPGFCMFQNIEAKTGTTFFYTSFHVRPET
jgi:hypothetical protein